MSRSRVKVLGKVVSYSVSPVVVGFCLQRFHLLVCSVIDIVQEWIPSESGGVRCRFLTARRMSCLSEHRRTDRTATNATTLPHTIAGILHGLGSTSRGSVHTIYTFSFARGSPIILLFPVLNICSQNSDGVNPMGR